MSRKKEQNIYEILNDNIVVLYSKDIKFLIDIDDLNKVLSYKWSVYGRYAPKANIKIEVKKTTISLHRFIMNINDPKVYIDHKNGNVLDNRKCNLRIVTPQQNCYNSSKKRITKSKYKGVNWDKERNRWAARISFNKKDYKIGRFKNEEEAREARDAYINASLRLHGEFSVFNRKKESV